MNDLPANPLSPSNRAAEARLDVALHELAGIGPASDLEARVLAVLTDDRPQPQASPHRGLLAAAALLGLGIVGSVAWLQHEPRSQPGTLPAPQDPPPSPTPDPAPKPAPPPVGRGATWIAEYAENRVLLIDGDGKELERIDEVFGAWDVEPIDGNRLLVVEFAMSCVREIDRTTKQTVWKFDNLRNPYDADRLPNGNTLIADTFAERVIEVDPKGTIVWTFGKGIRPFDCDRLPNGNTLIADALKDRVIEVDPKGEVVWEVREMWFPHDADRLPNGNTLVTLRRQAEVVEIDPKGKVVWRIAGLNSPSDADRLPNGNTLVAECQQVREFDPAGKEVWKQDAVWAVEACRVPR